MSLNSRLALLAIMILQLNFVEAQTSAKIGSLVVNADSMIRDLKAQKIFLKGHILLVFQGQNVRADLAVIDEQKKTVTAEGNISLVAVSQRAVGSRAEFNYESNTGVLYDAYIERGSQIQLSGKVIRKISEDDYEIESGNFTACTTCPPAWNFSGSTIKATVGRYAYITHSVMRIGSVPMFYFPYFIVPIATKRQSGFLFPSYGYGSSSKFVVSLPFFWAMNDSSDSTWTIENYQARGTKANLNYRYRLSENSFGEFSSSYIKDGAVGQELRQGRIPLSDTEKVDRSSVRYRHYFELPEGYVHRMDVNWASDILYPKDFPQDIRGHGDPALVSRMSLTKNTDTQHASVEVIHNRSMTAGAGVTVDDHGTPNGTPKDPRDADDLSINRFPSINYNVMPQQIWGDLLFEFDSRYTNFTRNGRAFDKLKSSGGTAITPIEIDPNPSNPESYNSKTDLLRTGQRFELEPKLSYPFNIGPYLDIIPSISFREANYEFSAGEQPSAFRRFFRGTISARTQFGRVFGDPEGTRYKHEFQPEIVYTNIPWIDSAKHPFFGENDPFYKQDNPLGNSDIPQFDDFDRLYDRHLTTFNLTNYIIKKSPNSSGSTYSQLLTLRMSQSYDNYEADRAVRLGEAREPWSPLSATLDIRLPYLDSNTTASYYHYDKLTKISSRVRLNSKHGSYLQVSYSQDFQLKKTVTQDGLTGLYNTQTEIQNYNRSLNTLMGYRAKYLGVAGLATYNILTQKFTDYGYLVDLFPPGDCWQISFGQVIPVSESQGEVFYFFNVGFNYGSGMQSTSPTALSRFR